MKSSKSVICKCEKCNKPFKSYIKEERMLCKTCKVALDEEKLKSLTGKTVHKTMTRSDFDAANNRFRNMAVRMEIRMAEIDAENARKDAEEKRQHEVAMTLKCKDCGEEFHINVGEKEWYESKGLCLPVRCSFCRAERRRLIESKRITE